MIKKYLIQFLIISVIVLLFFTWDSHFIISHYDRLYIVKYSAIAGLILFVLLLLLIGKTIFKRFKG